MPAIMNVSHYGRQLSKKNIQSLYSQILWFMNKTFKNLRKYKLISENVFNNVYFHFPTLEMSSHLKNSFCSKNKN